MKKYTKINLTYASFALALLTSLNLLNYADRNLFNALMDPIKAQFGFSDLQLGWLASAFLWVYAFAAFPLARIADRGSRKTILAIGAILWSVASFFTGLSRNFYQLLFSRGILGIGESAYATTVTPMLSDYFPAGLRSTALGLANVPLGIGTAVGYFVAGWSLHHFGWRHAFFILGFPGLALGIAAIFLREPEIGLSEKSAPRRPTREALRQLFRNTTLRYLWGSSILLTFSLGGMLVWMASLLHRDYGFTVSDAAIKGATAATIGSIIGVAAGGITSDRWNRLNPKSPIWITILSYALSGAFALLFLHVTGKTAALTCIGLVAFFQMAANGPQLAAMMNVTAPHLRSTCSAIYLFVIHVFGDAPSPAVIGFLSKKFGDLKTAIGFMPWIAILSAIVLIPALYSYLKDKARMEAA